MYTNWNPRAELAVSFKWYKLDDIVRYVHSLREYVIENIGKLSPSYIPHLESLSPASMTVRFSDQDIFVCEAIGDWNNKIDHLSLTVSMIVNNNKLERKYPCIRSQGDAEVTLLHWVDDILKAAELMQDAVDRTVFEQRYNLHWTLTPTTGKS